MITVTNSPSVAKTQAEHFRPDLEGLRGLAVIIVVLYHAKFLSGGYVALEVFFVLSGFLIAKLLFAEVMRSGTVDLGRFYSRRCFRLLPAATFVLLAVIAVTFLTLPQSFFESVLTDALYAVTYIANFRAIFQSVDYLSADNIASPLQHYWSLSVEEQFYFILPILFMLLAKIKGNFRSLSILVISLGVVASFSINVWLTDVSQPWAYFSLPTRAWEFGLGALLAIFFDSLKRLPRPIRIGMNWLGLILILGSAFLYGKQTIFPGYAVLLPTLGAAFQVISGCGGPIGSHNILLTNQVSRYFGRISYSLYLWHWPVLTIPLIASGNSMHWSLRVAGVILACLLAAVTTKLVEDPFRRRTPVHRRGAASLRLAFGSIGSVAVLVLAAQVFLHLNPGPSMNGLKPALADVSQDKPRIYDDHCSADFEQTWIPECVYGQKHSEVNVFLIGDSHAAQWFPALDLLAARRGWRLHAATKSACPFNTILVSKRAQNGIYQECTKWREVLLERIASVKPDLVIVSNSRLPAMVSKDGTLLHIEDRLSPWLLGLREALVSIKKSAKQVIVLADTPRPKFNVPDCLRRFGIQDHRCNTSRSVAVDEQWRSQERQVVNAIDVDYVDPVDWICTKSECPAIKNGILIFRDASHMTTAFAEHMVKNLDQMIVLRK